MATIFEPNEFQAGIIAMSFDEFVAETNIDEIARKELQQRSERTKRPATAEQIDARIKLYYEKRYRIDEWWPCGLKHLKYKVCECKRNRKSMADAMVQSVVRPQQDACTQYESDIGFLVPCAEQAIEGRVVLPAEPVRLSQSTQTEEPQDDASNPVAASQYVPEAKRLQQIVESMSVDGVYGNLGINEINGGQNDDDMATEEVRNKETVEPKNFCDSNKVAHVIRANEDNEMVWATDGDRETVLVTTEPEQQPVFISGTNEVNTESMFREVTDDSMVDTDFSDHSIDSTLMEADREMRETMHKSKSESILIEKPFVYIFRLLRFRTSVSYGIQRDLCAGHRKHKSELSTEALREEQEKRMHY